MNLVLINVSTRKFRIAVRLREGDVPAPAGSGVSKSAASRHAADCRAIVKFRRRTSGVSGSSFSDPVSCRQERVSNQDKLASDECFGIALRRTTFHASQTSQPEKGFGIEPLLGTLAPEMRHQQVDLAF
jgi:hypothetical protein